MRVITGRNVHQILPTAIRLLRLEGVQRTSRNGDVLQLHEPVTTVYEKPWERVVLWPRRDANPFFHLYEAFWMLDGRNDLAALTRYVSSFGQFSDDGRTLRGAYGHRWRKFFGVDQLADIVDMLDSDKNDRRAVLQMWDTDKDLHKRSKDLPCNMMITFQVATNGTLEMTVFNRSNDIVWGAYGANAVHLSMLHEYMAAAIGITMGRYRQVSVNWHGYLKTLEPMWDLELDAFGDKSDDLAAPLIQGNPYDTFAAIRMESWTQPKLDDAIQWLMRDIDSLYLDSSLKGPRLPMPADMANDEFWVTVHRVLEAHAVYKTQNKDRALCLLEDTPRQDADWVVAAREWLLRRQK